MLRRGAGAASGSEAVNSVEVGGGRQIVDVFVHRLAVVFHLGRFLKDGFFLNVLLRRWFFVKVEIATCEGLGGRRQLRFEFCTLRSPDLGRVHAELTDLQDGVTCAEFARIFAGSPPALTMMENFVGSFERRLACFL